MRSLTIRSIAATVAVGALLAGCGSDDDDDEPESAATTATQQAEPEAGTPEQLLGKYTRTVTKADIERTAKIRSELGPNQETPVPGPRSMEITDGKLTMIDRTEKPAFILDQEITATEDGKLEFVRYLNPEMASFCGPEIPQNATWRWERDGDTLTIEAVRDRCADRDSELAGEWKAR